MKHLNPFVIIFFILSFTNISLGGGLYQSFGLGYHHGIDYKQNVDSGYLDGSSWENEAADNGNGLNLRYLIGGGAADDDAGLERAIGLGAIVDLNYLHSKDSSYSAIGAGADCILGQYLRVQMGWGKAFFSDDLPTRAEDTKPDSVNGTFFFINAGLDLPASFLTSLLGLSFIEEGTFYLEYNMKWLAQDWQQGGVVFGINFWLDG